MNGPYHTGMNRLVLFGVCAAVLQVGQAAAQPTDTLSLAGALALARQHAPALRIVDARRDVAIGRARETSQFINPTVEYRRENLGSTLPPDIFATVYLPFDLTGRRLALRSAGSAATRRASADAIASRREAELQVVRAWLRAAVARDHAEVLRAQADALAEIARVDAERQREGIVAEGVALRTKLEADRARVTHAVAAGDLARARADLARTLGVPAETLPPIARLSAPRLPEPPDSVAASSLALQARPEVEAREAGLREAKARLGAEQRGAIGDWQLQGGSKKTGGVMTGQLGLALPFPIFNRNDGARQRARGELAEATAWNDDIVIGVRAETFAALTAYTALRAQAADVASFATRGREVATIARVAYAEGQASLVELLDAERASADALMAHARWAAEAWLARLELERALGLRLDDDGLLDMPLRSTLSPSTR